MLSKPYTYWWISPGGALHSVADAILQTDGRGRFVRFALRYHSDYLNLADSPALNPVHCPKSIDTFEWPGPDIPAVLDEVLPGVWERKLLLRWWQHRGDRRDADDLHAVLSHRQQFPIGAWTLLEKGHTPVISPGRNIEELGELTTEAGKVAIAADPEAHALDRLFNGSSVGGARPKTLVFDHNSKRHWLAKFSRKEDAFNHVRVEYACLRLAAICGLSVPQVNICNAGREILLVERFDTSAKGRYAIISANALLKDTRSQADKLHASYNDLIHLVQTHSEQVSQDLKQLFSQMLFNNCINNRDDHLRNFSFLHTGSGWRLSPAYDLVPSDSAGAYPILDFNYSPVLPSLAQATKVARYFQLSPSEARDTVQQLKDGVADWQAQFLRDEVSKRDIKLLSMLFHNA